jgi:hypothetical protein
MSIPPINNIDKPTQEVASSESLQLSRQYWPVSRALMLAACESNHEIAEQTRITIAESVALLSKLRELGH